MDKQQTIALIEGQLATGKISKEDLIKIIGVENKIQFQLTETAPEKIIDREENSKDLTNIFYVIGAIIAIVGIGVLVGQNWKEIGFIGRILVTLGISLITYIIGLVTRSKEQKILSQVMFIISAILSPLGSYVLINESVIKYSVTTQFITAIVLTVVFGTAFLINRRNILILIIAGFVSWAYYTLLIRLLGPNQINDILKWASMLLGLAYILAGYGCKKILQDKNVDEEEENKTIQNTLYGFGTLAILGAGIYIGGIFDLLFIILIFSAFYGSVFLKSQSMLILGSVFLMAHIFKITSKYFINSIGWSISLIIAGFLVVCIGYATFYLNKKIISIKK